MAFKNLSLNKQFFSYLATYLVGSWSIIQFVEWFCQRYNFSNSWTDIIAVLLVLLLPSALLFSWLHSDEKHQFKRQKLVYALNIGVILMGLVPISQGYSLEPTTEKLTVTDENGLEKEVEVSKQKYIRQLVFLPFQNDENLEWLSVAFPTLISTDVNQCKRFNTYAAINFLRAVKELDYSVKDKIPQNIQSKLVNDYLTDYVVSGSINQENTNSYRYSLSLFNQKTAKITYTIEGKTNDIFATADSLSVALNQYIFKEDLNISFDDYKNLPTIEQFSANKAAFQAHWEAQTNFFGEKFDLALAKAKEAIKEDKRFAEAYNLRGLIHYFNGKIQEGRADFQKALQHSSSTSDHQQRMIKGNYYKYGDDRRKTQDFFEMWMKIHPEDFSPFNTLISLHDANRARDKAIAVAHQAERMGHEKRVAYMLAAFYAQEKNQEKAEAYIQKYKEFFPDNLEIEKDIGGIYFSQGEFETALLHYKNFQTLNPIDLGVHISLSSCNFQLGNYELAEELGADLMTKAANISDTIQAYGYLERLYQRRGQVKKAINLMEKRWALQEKHYPPLSILTEKASPGAVSRYYIIGDEISPQKHIRAVGAAFDGQSKEYENIYWLNYYYNTENAEKFNEYLTKYNSYFEKNISPDMFSALTGYAKKFQGKYQEAIDILAPIAEKGTDRGAASQLYDCYRLNQQYDKAIEGFESYMDKSTVYGFTLLRYAQSLNDGGQIEKAKAVIKRLLKMWENADEEYIYNQEAVKLNEQVNLLN